MPRILFVLTLLLALSLTALTQPDPNAPPIPIPPVAPNAGGLGGLMGGVMGAAAQANLKLLLLANGVFVLNNGVLARYDPATLKPQGALDLLDPMPEAPQLPQNPNDQDRAAMLGWFMARLQHGAEPAVLVQDNRFYIVIGTKYFCVNPDTLQIDVKSDLANANLQPLGLLGKPQLTLTDGVLYVAQNQELLSVDPATGKVTARVSLPKRMF